MSKSRSFSPEQRLEQFISATRSVSEKKGIPTWKIGFEPDWRIRQLLNPFFRDFGQHTPDWIVQKFRDAFALRAG